MPSNHLILCCPLLLLPQSFPASGSFQMSQLFASGRQSIGVSASASDLPSPEYSGLISFRMDWLDLLAVQGTLESLLQHHSSKASILRCSAFFIVQLSHLYMTTGKTIALTSRTFVDKVMSLLFNVLSRLIITFLPRSRHLLISWLQLLGEAHWLKPPTLARHHSNHCMSCFMAGDPDKEYGANKPPPAGRVRERSRGNTTCPSTSQNPSC